MDQDKSHSDSEDEFPESTRSERVDKRKLSRSSTGDGDEWVLVNSLGSEVENSACQVRSIDVETFANFRAPISRDHATVAIRQQPPLIAQSLAIEQVDEPKNELASDSEPKEQLPTEEITSAASLTAPAVCESTDNEIDDVAFYAEELSVKSIESSQTSVSVNGEFMLEDMPLSMESSTGGSSSIGYELVNTTRSTADQTEEEQFGNEPETVASSDPVDDDVSAFRLRLATRGENSNQHFKLALLFLFASTVVIAIGIGKIICIKQDIARFRMSRDAGIREMQEEQLKGLQGRLSDCVDKLHDAEAYLDDSRTISRGCQDDYCTAEEKPICGVAQSDFGAQIADCTKRLTTCQRRLSDAEEEGKKRTDSLAKAFQDLRLLRHNMIQIHSTYERLARLLISQNRRDDSTTFGTVASKTNDEEVQELTKKLSEAESRESNLIKQELELRQSLSELESTVVALNAELTKMKTKTGDHKKQYVHGDDTVDETEEPLAQDEELGNLEFNWTRFSDLLQQLKKTANFDEIIESYFDMFKDLQLPDIDVSKLWPKELPSKMEKAATNLKQILDGKVTDLEKRLYSTDWDGYVQKAKDVTARVGDTVGTLWQKAKDLSDHVKEQHGEQGEKILNSIKTTVEKASEVFDQRWEQAARFWRDVIGSSSGFDDEDESGADDNADSILWEDADHHQPDAADSDEFNHWTRDEDLPQGEVGGVAQNEAEANPWLSAELGGPDLADEVMQLRQLLKASSIFSRYITDEFADHYFRRLEHAARLLSRDPKDEAAWWLCQKLWWGRHPFANGRQCSDKLMTWQRHVRVDADVRQKLVDQIPNLRILIKKLVSDGTPDLRDGASWVFDWAKSRQEMRKEEEKNSWLYDRWHSRDELRHQQQVDLATATSKWLFRRGKEREKKREEPIPSSHRRRATTEAKGPTKKQKNGFQSQKTRR